MPVPISSNLAYTGIPAENNAILAQQRVFLVENIRSARRFISSMKCGLVLDECHFFELETLEKEHTLLQEALLHWKAHGSAVVLSESGCPGVADPGAFMVKWAHKHQVNVIPLVGPSSIVMALMASGFSGQSFTFHGYVPIDKAQRKHKIMEMEQVAVAKGFTQIFMDTPYRNNQLVSDLLAICRPETMLCIASDITGEQQMIKTQSIALWKKQNIQMAKVPAMFLLGR
jgi:16S rRNA (cytidine1402-2'-O)-methyltransferase